MRGKEDRAAANQRASDALYQARRRAVAECHNPVTPSVPVDDRVLREVELFDVPDAWDRLNVEYLLAEWPPSMLS
jgi:hypothetical protein